MVCLSDLSVFHDCEPCKTAESFQMLLRMWTQVGPRNHVLDGDAHRRKLMNMTELSMCGGDAALRQITLT